MCNWYPDHNPSTPEIPLVLLLSTHLLPQVNYYPIFQHSGLVLPVFVQCKQSWYVLFYVWHSALFSRFILLHGVVQCSSIA